MSSDLDFIDALDKVAPGKENLQAITKGAEESLLIITPWHAAQTENPEIQKMITTIVGHCTAYVVAIDKSIKTADDGYAISDEALELCETLLDPDTDPETLQGLLGDMQEHTKKALENCQSTMKMFNAVQTGLFEMTKAIPKAALEAKDGDKSRIIRFRDALASNSLATKVASSLGWKSVDIVAAMKDLNLAALKVAKLSENVDEFVKWWTIMETNLKVASKKSSELTPDKVKAFRIKAIQKKWTDIKSDYAEYKVEIVKLRGFYPKSIEVHSD